MWKTAFIIGMMLSLGASANTCNTQSIEGVIALLKQSPQEKHLKDTTDRFLELKYEQETRRSRPEFSAGLNLDKDNVKNQEITAELLFSIDDLRNYSLREKINTADRSLKTTDYLKDSNDRLSQTAISMFKISQNKFLLEKIDGLLTTINSSESIYKSRAIRSRDDEIVLSSLGLLKNNLILKKARLQDHIFENQLILKKWDNVDCLVDYNNFSELIKNLKFNSMDDSQLISMKELQLKADVIQNTIQLESRKYFSNFKIGPSFSREKTDESSLVRFGVSLSFDIPTLNNSNYNYIQQAESLATLEKARKEKVVEIDKIIVEDRFKKYSESLRSLPSQDKLESDIRKIKKSFDAGVVSPLVYLESYRSYVDFLEVSEEVRLNVLESYLKLRGLYVETNS